MEERYRFNIYNNHIAYFYDNGVLVHSIITIYDIEKLLNQQDTRIKELESRLRVSNSQLASYELKYDEFKKDYKKQEDLLKFYLKNNSELNLENQQLKQAQNQKAIEVLKKIKNYFLDTEDWLVDSCAIEEFIINLIK